jgi:5-methylcytosine-specific restriction enzyme A
MMHWLIPANTKFYDVFGALNRADTYWPINAKIEVGDSVFLYLTAPYKQIGFLCEVKDIGSSFEDALPHIKQFFRKPTDHKKKPTKFMKLHCTVTFQIVNRSPLSYDCLKQHGLNGMLMGPRKLENNLKLLQYINEVCNEL